MAYNLQRLPDLDKVPDNPGHVGHHEAPPRPRTWIAKDSDFLPSVSLAAVLFLVFVFVLLLLFQPHKDYIRKPSNLSAKTIQFHPLLYGQPLLTQLTVERLARTVDEEVTVIAVAGEDATRTLECFSTSLVSLLADRRRTSLPIKQVREYVPPADIWSYNANRLPTIYSVTVITREKRKEPQGVILSLPSPRTKHLHVTEITTKSQQKDFNKSLSIATGLLHHLYKARNFPETSEFRKSIGHSLRLIEIKGDPYLESGLVC